MTDKLTSAHLALSAYNDTVSKSSLGAQNFRTIKTRQPWGQYAVSPLVRVHRGTIWCPCFPAGFRGMDKRRRDMWRSGSAMEATGHSLLFRAKRPPCRFDPAAGQGDSLRRGNASLVAAKLL